MKKEIKPYAFIDREGNKVTRESHMAEKDYREGNEVTIDMAENVGRAYGFFYCDASKQEIETELPIIRELVNTPSQLELSLIEGMDNISELYSKAESVKKGDERLAPFAFFKLLILAQKAKQDGTNYVLQATYPGGSNRDTADEVASILNQAYQSPLYEANAPFKGSVVHEEKGDYVFRYPVFRYPFSL